MFQTERFLVKIEIGELCFGGISLLLEEGKEFIDSGGLVVLDDGI
jgi:hypothetical protein